MTSPSIDKLRTACGLCALLTLMALAATEARAQDRLLVPSPPAPPPLKYITAGERTQLSTARDAKARIKASIEMAANRLLRAEQYTVDQRYIAATSELGIYQALIEDAIGFLGRQKPDSNKTRDLYRRLEIELRVHGNRIESMRRVTPSEYAGHVEAIVDFAHEARTNCFNAFFSDTVLQDGTENKTKASVKESNADSTEKKPGKP